MLLYPSVDKLLEKVDSRYKLIALAGKRSRELDGDGSKQIEPKSPTIEKFNSNKTIGKALEEIEQGNVVIDDKKTP